MNLTPEQLAAIALLRHAWFDVNDEIDATLRADISADIEPLFDALTVLSDAIYHLRRGNE